MPENIRWEQFQKGDTTAFELIFQEHWDALMRYTCSIIFDDAMAKDILQNFFLELWEKRSQLPVPRETRAFLLFLLKLRILNAMRREDIRSRHENSFALLLQEHTNTTTDHIYYKQLYEELRENIHLLPPSVKQVFELSCFEHLSVPEIAARLGTSEQTVRNQLNTANKKLKTMLKGSVASFLL
ncbi:RNA polymerase sigma factor [Chitinophaga sp. Cy-1792]|uniref:RNA polymerase sigma factor n=1 Tax=Chitinophaga sp. Cy-1792 TaxID=2608339 RepID=UPI001422299F|nr:sigma-70 family RNA polymerase sigma factor [Chitinophaga sp. Cy-1792]NIG55090.1 sigma-70 family RNA polymerase sigma factor [Chitinophaga sp. Cy-1792]